MHVVVLVKQVPDTTEIRIDPKTGTLQRAGIPSILNPYDLPALEEALRLKDRFGAGVTVLTMGPPQAREALRRCVGYGADKAILLTDRIMAGADTLATTYALWRALLKLHAEEPIDLIFTGKQTIDGDTGQVGPGVAHRMKFQQLTNVIKLRHIDPATGDVEVERVVEDAREVLRSRLPAVISVVKEINTPRYPSLPSFIRGYRYEPIVWNSQNTDLDPALCGLKGSPTIVSKTFSPPAKDHHCEFLGPGEDADGKAQALVDVLLAHPVLRRRPVAPERAEGVRSEAEPLAAVGSRGPAAAGAPAGAGPSGDGR